MSIYNIKSAKPVFLNPDEPTIVLHFVSVQRSFDSICARVQPSMACIRRFHRWHNQTLNPDRRIRVIPAKIYLFLY